MKEVFICILVDLGLLFVFFGLYFLIGEECVNVVVGVGDVLELIIVIVVYMIVIVVVFIFVYMK